MRCKHRIRTFYDATRHSKHLQCSMLLTLFLYGFWHWSLQLILRIKMFWVVSLYHEAVEMEIYEPCFPWGSHKKSKLLSLEVYLCKTFSLVRTPGKKSMLMSESWLHKSIHLISNLSQFVVLTSCKWGVSDFTECEWCSRF